jgi:hypothetical protein
MSGFTERTSRGVNADISFDRNDSVAISRAILQCRQIKMLLGVFFAACDPNKFAKMRMFLQPFPTNNDDGSNK